MLEIANTINFLGRTPPADTDITDSVIELKAQFDQIDGDAIKDPVGHANYNAVFFIVRRRYLAGVIPSDFLN